ncbi:MAG: DegT/DnrJ/EryC1/StrS family aminotransferase [Gammaproteobacteria bacterium]|nr:DegT/DnrJ/EryC1/StrS family aminotransferase [Gammaproteobacteria bacterium]
MLAKLKKDKCEVVVPAYTCYSVAASIEEAGLKMVLSDVVPETLDFDYQKLKSVVHDKTLCIISTHFFSKSADIDQARKLADSVGAYLVEDAAQSGIDPERGVMTSDIIVYSFGRGKPISTNGGGILAVSCDEISAELTSRHKVMPMPGRIRELKSALMMLMNDLLIQPSIFWLPARLPFLGIGRTVYPDYISMERMGRLRVLLLQRLLKRLPTLKASRRECAGFYFNRLKKCGRVSLLAHLEKSESFPIRFPCYLEGDIELSRKNKSLSGRELGISQMYPQGLHKLKEIKGFCLNYGDDFPGADFVSNHLVTLPTHLLVNASVRRQVVAWLVGE